MKLISIVTENFKKLGSRTIEFSDGVNFIVGENGQGKSTVLRAIAVALFGPTMLPGLSDDIPTRGTTTWGLTLTIERGGKTYVIQRGKSKASVSVDGDLQANGQLPTTAYIEELLGISAKDYNLLIHSRQGETNYVINYGATALQRKVEEFAGISEIDSIVVEANKRGKAAKEKVEWLQASMETKEAYDESVQALKEATEAAEGLAKELKTLEDTPPPEEPIKPDFDLSVERSKLRKFVAYQGDLKEALREKAQREEQLAELKPPMDLPDTDALQSKLTELREALTAAKSSHTAANEAQTKKEVLEESVASMEMNKHPVPTQEELEAAQANVDKGTVQLEELVSEVSQLKANIVSIRKEISEGVCSSCGTVLSTDKDALEAALAKLLLDESQVVERVSRAKEILDAATKVLREFNADIEAARLYKASLQTAKDNLASLLVPEAEGDPEALQEAIFQATEKLRTASVVVEEAEALERSRRKLQRQLNSIEIPSPVEETTQEAIEQMESLQSKYEAAHASWTFAAKNLAAEIQAQQSLVSYSQEKISTLTDKIMREDNKLAEIKQLQAENDIAARLSKYLRDRRAAYLEEVWTSILTIASRFLNESSRGWMEETTIQDGKFMFREEGTWVPAVETSGAQSAFLGTALRIGLNKALYRSSTFLGFDEPTEAMREDNARNLVTAISGEAKQVLLITHRESDQSLANNIIEV